MISQSKDIILLLGAGASAEADIPTSAEMIGSIEQLLLSDIRWKSYAPLYNHVKSAIHYAAGLRGCFDKQIVYNIEVLVNTLYELERNEEHPLYPFIASWNSRFVALAEPGFSKIREFRREILKELKRWMCPEDPSKGDYYKGIAQLQSDLNFPLPIFSLNYDLCVERLSKDGLQLETGFGGVGPSYVWNWERFEEVGPNPLPQIFLYKLHGSVNWKRDEATKQLYSVDQIEKVDVDNMEVIFGRDFKLEAADPYLFYAYKFRDYSLIAKLIIAVGYGFGDAHINKMITQAIRNDRNRKLFVVCNCDSATQDRAREIAERLDIQSQIGQVYVHSGTTKQFLEQPDLAKLLIEQIPVNPESPF